jgi:hypothetical protein
MFDSITQVETALLYIICGLILFISSFTVLVVFICYKELRHGIYSMIIGTTASEMYLGLHSITNGIYGLTRDDHSPINEIYCKTEGMFTVFFWSFWSILNISIMILYVKRKLKHSQLSRFLMVMSISVAAILAFLSYINGDTGISFSKTCFITPNKDLSTLLLAFLFYLQFAVSIIFNIWFFFCRDTSTDRSFINGYNYFLLITSCFWLFLVTHLVLVCFFDINNKILYYLALFLTHFCYIYMSIFRLQIEYVRIVFSQGPTTYKSLNCIFIVMGCYSKPKFKDIKKVLNIKYIESEGQINDTQDTIYSHIMKSTDI